jgi:hypothetical protein
MEIDLIKVKSAIESGKTIKEVIADLSLGDVSEIMLEAMLVQEFGESIKEKIPKANKVDDAVLEVIKQRIESGVPVPVAIRQSNIPPTDIIKVAGQLRKKYGAELLKVRQELTKATTMPKLTLEQFLDRLDMMIKRLDPLKDKAKILEIRTGLRQLLMSVEEKNKASEY